MQVLQPTCRRLFNCNCHGNTYIIIMGTTKCRNEEMRNENGNEEIRNGGNEIEYGKARAREPKTSSISCREKSWQR